ncbi:MAG: VanZ family protein [Candidatus Kapaibacteriales bacterium]
MAILIFVLSSLHKPFVEINQFVWEDKLIHFLVFFAFGISLLLPLSSRILKSEKEKKAILLVVIIGLLYGAIDEIHQSYVPGRVCDLTDWIADAVGVILAILLRVPILNLIIKR